MEHEYLQTKIDKINDILIRQTVMTEKLTEIVNKQDIRISELEKATFKSGKWYSTKTGSFVIKAAFFILLIILCSAIGINIFQLLNVFKGS